MVPESREEAISVSSVKFFTGIPCRNGHVDFRYTNTGICYSCKRGQNNRDYQNHTERVLESCHRSYLNNRESNIKASQKWAENNREKSNEIKKRYRNKNLKEVQKKQREYQREKIKDPTYRLSKNISKAIWSWLKGNKNYRHWEDFVDYSLEELREHLESQFDNYMSWDNYGSYWHVDHIKPKSLCESFEEIWKLSNLQPLEARKNLSKNNRYIG